ncbi:MAG: DUF1800 family protein, partial [Henriciella sp.]|uniref:DUF1800 domain-containing protein n=1 Tax=Henriciella sp. TaxID=1968823 RepID=UPI003C76E97C
APTHSFWMNAIGGDDQLRQRTAFALSQIFVISGSEMASDQLFIRPTAVAHFQDVLVENAFGNFRDLLHDVTYSPAMAMYLTYLKSEKADPETGRMPDENYAREVMQLFTIGLNELNPDGTLKLDGNGDPIETYSTSDVTEMAKVFTGLSLDTPVFYSKLNPPDQDALYRPLVMFDHKHSSEPKRIFGTVIPANTPGEQSIDMALDTLFEHPNVGPFISRQLIQRFVTSNPDPAYVARVAAAFERGTYELPDGTVVGTTGRGDMKAVIAAVLMDEEARSDAARRDPTYGKIREPVLRFTHWARAFNASQLSPWDSWMLFNTALPEALYQGPYKSQSVFNFYRPGYVAPGTATGAAEMTVPELQITNATTVVGYTNFMTYFVYRRGLTREDAQATSFIANYDEAFSLADRPAELVDYLDDALTNGELSDALESRIVEAITPLSIEDDPDNLRDGPIVRVGTAILLIMTSPDYVVQR